MYRQTLADLKYISYSLIFEFHLIDDRIMGKNYRNAQWLTDSLVAN